ncbi:hypothetical protein LEP1GSC062_4012 [Leptospira alexanderi serovar Manhao 3 str. L 60]|uniref:Uncharacterized protein n=1 Tax=Leptospira alexanderi serovar Manhao 3 str. L 60 TaxID=1049759 RepID=V6I4B9_9LEPT|nr:hypothetical protein LEP1GSC062_4012 [Leptospira alexanderi serovar Manhao 3 str. L 60]
MILFYAGNVRDRIGNRNYLYCRFFIWINASECFRGYNRSIVSSKNALVPIDYVSLGNLWADSYCCQTLVGVPIILMLWDRLLTGVP